MGGLLFTVRGWIGNDRFLDSALAALMVAFAVALTVDIAIDANWIPELFFGVFVVALVAIHRSGKAPARPSGEMLTGLGWMLILFVATLALLRVYTRVTDVLG